MTTEKTTDQELKTAAEASFSDGQDGENQPAAPETDSATSTSPGVTAEFLQQQLSKKDETISALREQAASSALQAQIDALESENRNADIADSREVDSGEMSAEEAIQRSHERQDAAKEKAQGLQQQSQAQEATEADYVNSALLARFSYAQEFAQDPNWIGMDNGGRQFKEGCPFVNVKRDILGEDQDLVIGLCVQRSLN